MKILHTADWHLADRLKQIDRTADLQRAVERIARYCDQESVDVLLIAGDLFSELARPEALQASLAHLVQTFRSFLVHGGTIVAIAGNHDNDIYCETLRRAFQLAAPNLARPGDTLSTGRFYLTTKPVHFSLRSRSGLIVQFACMPYPTISRYAHCLPTTTYSCFEERCQLLREAFINQLRTFRRQLDRRQPSVLVTHINAIPANPLQLFRSGVDEDIVVDDPALTSGWTYVALGHLHGPGKLQGLEHVWYAGSIERLNITEKDQQKGVVLVTLHGVSGRPQTEFLPLPATPFYDICINDPRKELLLLGQRYRDATTALARCHVQFRPQEDNLRDILSELSRVFPRCYERTWSERRDRPARSRAATDAGDVTNILHSQRAGNGPPFDIPHRKTLPDIGCSLRQLVIGYLTDQLAGDADQEAILAVVRQLLEESK